MQYKEKHKNSKTAKYPGYAKELHERGQLFLRKCKPGRL